MTKTRMAPGGVYIPLAKYELDKNPSDEDVRKVCAQIAASLTALLVANPSAFAQ